MKYKATRKELKDGYYHIIGISYCNAQYLLDFENAESYCSGKTGWSCDNYNINGVLVSTGYNYISNKNTSYDYEKLREYNQKAEEIRLNYHMKWEDQKEQIRKLLNEFIKSCEIETV